MSNSGRNLGSDQKIVDENKPQSGQTAYVITQCLSLNIPARDSIEDKCEEIKSGKSPVTYSGALYQIKDFKKLIKTLNNMQAGQVKHLIFDQIFTLHAINSSKEFLKIWNAVKSKVEEVTFSACTMKQEVLDQIKSDIHSAENISVKKINIPHTDIIELNTNNSNQDLHYTSRP